MRFWLRVRLRRRRYSRLLWDLVELRADATVGEKVHLDQAFDIILGAKYAFEDVAGRQSFKVRDGSGK